jgi:hypothetical protein
VVPALETALAAELDGAPAPTCTLGPVTGRLAGQWLGTPVHGLDDLAAAVFDATVAVVPVRHPQPFDAQVVLARGRVPRHLAGQQVSATWVARSVSLVADRSAPGHTRFEDSRCSHSHRPGIADVGARHPYATDRTQRGNPHERNE